LTEISTRDAATGRIADDYLRFLELYDEAEREPAAAG